MTAADADADAQQQQAHEEKEDLKIEAIDWLLFEDAHRGEALKQSNTVMRGFLKNKDYVRVFKVLEMIPDDSVAKALDHAISDGAEDEHDNVIYNAVTEHTSFKKWAEASEAFDVWREFLENADAQRASHYDSFLDEKFQDAEQKILSVLDFKQEWFEQFGAKVPGWLQDEAVDEDDDDGQTGRQADLKKLRVRDIPTFVSDLWWLLHEMGAHYAQREMRTEALAHYNKAVEISQRLAHHVHGEALLDAYRHPDNAGKLQELLLNFAETAEEILDLVHGSRTDSLGYE